MPIFNDYSKEGKFLATRDVPLDTTNLPRYLEECGNERAKGYQDALNDFVRELYDQTHMPSGENGIRTRPDSAIVRIVFKFLDNKKELSNSITKILDQSNIASGTPSSPLSDTKIQL